MRSWRDNFNAVRFAAQHNTLVKRRVGVLSEVLSFIYLTTGVLYKDTAQHGVCARESQPGELEAAG